MIIYSFNVRSGTYESFAVGFRDRKGRKDHLVKVKLPIVEMTKLSESSGKENCQICDFVYDANNFSNKTSGETF